MKSLELGDGANHSDSNESGSTMAPLNDTKAKRKYFPLSEEAKSKKNARRRKYHQPLPSFRKDDIRRSFPAMIANVCNAKDTYFSTNFYRHFCRPDCTFIDYARLSDQEDASHSSLQMSPLTYLEGIDAIIRCVLAYDSLSPDGIVNLHASQIRVSADRTVIISRVSYQGTLFHYSLPHERDPEVIRLLGSGNSLLRDADGIRANGPEATELQELIISQRNSSMNWSSTINPLPIPCPYHSFGYIVITLDNDIHITNIECLDDASFLEFYDPNKVSLTVS